MNYIQKQAALQKLATMRLAINYVARQRGMQKYAKEDVDAELIAKLKNQRDRSLAWDLVSKMGWRGLQGLGIGAGIGGVAGGITGASAGALMGSQIGHAGLGAGVVGGLGAVAGAGKGGYYGTGIGAIAGGLESLLTYSDRKQRAINRLKELGVKDNVVD